MIETRRPQRLPAYALYGEPLSAGAPALDRLHCESIAERSRLHGWEIRPHRHEALFQVLYVARGRARAEFDGRPLLLEGPAVLTVPSLAAHGFRFAPDIDGLVFTVDELHLSNLLQPHAGLAERLLRPRGAALPPDDAQVPAAAAALRDEALAHGAWRGAALDAALLRLAVALARSLPPEATPADGQARGTPPAGARALAHVQRLRTLVEAQYRRQPSQSQLAAQLGITPTQLNRACRQVLGHAAQGVLHARLLRQAQRELAYTNLSVKQIALELGFKDASYFTRFFARGLGLRPAAWRQAQRAGTATA
jgi:AraC family transcriptional activator of pobA